MIRKLSLPEIVEAIRGLDAEDLATLVELLGGESGDDASPHVQDEPWAARSAASLATAFGPSEPAASEKELIP